MAEKLIKRVMTESGALQVDYEALANLPVSDDTLSISGRFADAKVTGDEIKELSSNLETKTSEITNSLNEKTEKITTDMTDLNTKVSNITSELDTEINPSINDLDARITDISEKMVSKDENGNLSMEGIKITNIPSPENNTDPANKEYVDNKHFIINAILGTDWTGEACPFSQTITIDEILETDCPHITPIYSDTLETAILEKNAWSEVSKAVTGTSSITFTCFMRKPSTPINIQVEVNR